MNAVESIANTLLSTAFALWPQTKPSAEKLKTAKLVAHRGVHENNLAQENSMASFRLALENKIWAVELDIHFTKDSMPVVNHDPHCKRLFNRPDINIKDINFSDLRKEIPELPSLEEVIREFGKKLHLMIEIKEDLSHSPQDILKLKEVLSTLTPQTDYHLLSLAPEYLEPLSFAPKNTLLDVIWLDAKGVLNKNKNLNHGAIAGHFLFFNADDLKNLKAQNKKVGLGFLDSRNSLYREVNRGADFIFTNHPLRLSTYLAE